MPPLGSLVFMALELKFSKSCRIRGISLLAVPLSYYLEVECWNVEPQKMPELHLHGEVELNQDKFQEIKAFLSQLKQPICLISYYGINNDFPLFRYWFQEKNLSLSEDVMCADGLDTFYNIHKLELEKFPFGNAVRRIFFEGDTKPTFSFKLSNIYDGIAGLSSEDIVRQTAGISVYLGKRFLDWVEEKQKHFSTIPARERLIKLCSRKAK